MEGGNAFSKSCEVQKSLDKREEMFCPVSESCLVFFFYEISGLFSKSLAATINTELEIPFLTIHYSAGI